MQVRNRISSEQVISQNSEHLLGWRVSPPAPLRSRLGPSSIETASGHLSSRDLKKSHNVTATVAWERMTTVPHNLHSGGPREFSVPFPCCTYCRYETRELWGPSLWPDSSSKIQRAVIGNLSAHP